MPPLPAAAGAVRVALQHITAANLDIITRFYINYTGTAPTVGQLDTFCAAVGTAWNANLKAYTDSTITLATVTAIDETSATSAEGTSSPNIAGSLAGTALPIDNCVVASYEVARRYRGGHPRGYWPLLNESSLASDRTWSAGAIGDLQTSIPAFFAAILADGWAGAGILSHVNISYFFGFVAVENPITHRYRNYPEPRATPLQDLVTSIIVRTYVGSQRRRLGKR